MNLEDTIAAISTPSGEGGIGVIRISGPLAAHVAEALFVPDHGQVSYFKSHHVHLGRVVDPRSQAALDRALLTLFRSPKSYTGEDVAEISCHGGSFLLARVLEAALTQGARLAEPGEFTLRAFLRGRLDLAQAEAVIDLIRAHADTSVRLAEGQLEGFLSKEVSKIREPLRDLLTQLEAVLDFPEEVPEPDPENIHQTLKHGLQKIEALAATAEQGKIYREGASVVIIGRPNVGKSSLMNALLREARAIVTPVSGTTRDVLEETASLRGIPIRAIDTAGIRRPRGQVEAIGIERTRQQLAKADLVLLVVDGSRKLSTQDKEIISELGSQKLVIALNKQDQPQKLKLDDLQKALELVEIHDAPVISLSAYTGEGLFELEEMLASKLVGSTDQIGETPLVANLRHRDALRRAAEALHEALHTLEEELPLDLLSVDLTTALEAISEITGESVQEELLERIFSQFCIGK